MTTAKQKIQQLGRIHVHFSRGSYLEGFEAAIKNINSGVVISNENSMIDTERIDRFEGGLVSKQSVDLEKMTGNIRVLDLVRLMLSKPTCTYFPGTLLRDFGSYCLPTMPVIQNGKIILERIKQTGIPYVDSPASLAEKLIGKEYAEKIRGYVGAQWKEPIKTLNETLGKKVAEQRKACLRAVSVNRLSVLPVICNELSLISDLYKGKPVDVIVHTSDSSFYNYNDREMLESYTKTLEALEEKGKLKVPTIMLTAGNEKNQHKETLVYEGGKLN